MYMALPRNMYTSLDHGELNIPGRTNNIDAQLDAYKRNQIAARKLQAKTDAARRREEKALARQLYDQHGSALIESMAHKFDRKELRKMLESQLKWEPAKIIKTLLRFNS